MTPTPEQLAPLRSEYSKIIVSAGEGAGKSWDAGVYTTARMLYDLAKNGFADDGNAVSRLYWVIGESYEDAFKDWKYILANCETLGIVMPGTTHIRDEGREMCSFRTKYGQAVETKTGADPTAIAREDLDGIVGAEASRWSAELFNRVWGRLARRLNYGAWGFLSGSPESSLGPFVSWYKLGEGANTFGLKSFNMPTWSNTFLYPEGINSPAIVQLRSVTPEDRFFERYGGRPAQPRNAVLPEFSYALHVDPDLVYVDGADTYLFVDPGDYVHAVLFVQIVGPEIHVVDELYIHRGTHESVVLAAKLRPGWKYTQKTRRIVIDIAGYQHHGGDSATEAWTSGTGYWVSGNKNPVEATIDKVRTALTVNPTTGRPRLRIRPECSGLIAEAGAGPSPVPGGGAWLRHSENGRPKAENDHAWKALGYGLIDLFGTDMPSETYEEPGQQEADLTYLKWRVA